MWAEPEIQTAAELWKRGLSASEIAAVLPGRSRNAVIGQVFRLGLCRAPGTGRSGPCQPRIVSEQIETAEEEGIMPPIPPAETEAVTVMSVRHGQCRWPMGSPSDGGEMPMCGHETHNGLPYCPFHHAKAYVKPIKSKAKVNGLRRGGPRD